ncbi:gliding motility-associated C-terminal domain-containing protein [Flavivirga jejuensis]|uniref:Gliding motility-associated C-terminal domain-containing protein n=1 Tax=Flavivirga jejuensis TaxID=870487 RepID=A0ABT8WSU3_9FLAO|nr:gliding motility-associated C-terminal domain-containing protein [Flavivirga jejuensis]MDO5976184.1 gliding motility-associated C-terminal domain-containing protein [Flavivirga jejuensis]
MRNFTFTNFIVLILLFVVGKAYAQPKIGKPSFEFTKTCANPDFNTFEVKFDFTESGLGASNQFIIELSDEAGNFSDPAVILYTSSVGEIITSPGIINFSVPTTIAGEGFKLRVKGTDPVETSVSSDAFPAYYKFVDTGFSINNLENTGVFCSGGSYLLTIDNPDLINNNSPLQYPSLSYTWHRVTGPTTSDPFASGASLAVSDPGTYFVVINYGSCTSETARSNKVTVSEASAGGASSITSSLGDSFCASVGLTTLSTVSANSYQWFKDGNEISGATEQTYQTNESGTFSVNITLNGCSTSASITLDANQFTSSIDVSELPGVNLMPASGTLDINITDTANSPEYEWYLNDTLITGENSSSYEATQIGNYKAVIYQTIGCISSKEFLFVINDAFPEVEKIPNLISPNGDGQNDTWVIPQTFVSGTNAEVLIISSRGEIVLQTNDYQNNWPENELDFKSVNPVYYYIITTEDQKTRKGSITVVK